MITASYSDCGATRRHCGCQPCWPPQASRSSVQAENFRIVESGSQVGVLWIVRRIDEHGGTPALTEHFDRELGADLGELRLHVANRQALAQAMAVIARRGPPDHPTVWC